MASVAQLVGVPSHTQKGYGFDSQSGHIPRLQVQSLVWVHMIPGTGVYERQPIDVPLSYQCVCVCVSLSVSLPHPLPPSSLSKNSETNVLG